MKFTDVGIISYGTELPLTCIKGSSIGNASHSLGIEQKTVPALDEDAVTLATQAAFQAMGRSSLKPTQVEALFIGSESHPYAVKPTGSIIANALGLPRSLSVADLQFACKAGTQSVQIIASYVQAHLIAAGLAIGSDTAQSEPGDVLEYTAGAGAAAFLLGREEIIVKLHGSVSIATDTADFWRRPGQAYPKHAGRLSGEPGYFSHVSEACTTLLEEMSLHSSDIDYCVFHTPNGKFPHLIASRLGFKSTQLSDSLVVGQIGNTYTAASLIALASLLDVAQSGKSILMCSYGSGAGADAFLFETTPLLIQKRAQWSEYVREKIGKLVAISYDQYQKQTRCR